MAQRMKSLYLDRVFPEPVGRVKLASGVTLKAEWRKRNDLLTWLYEHEEYRPLLVALRSHRVTVARVVEADRADRLKALLADLTRPDQPLDRPLWGAVAAWLPTSAPAAPTRKRYKVSLDHLQRSGVLSASATIGDLAALDWKALLVAWPTSAANWNHQRRGLSKFLSDQLETEEVPGALHPFHAKLFRKRSGHRDALIPRLDERPFERVPDLSVQTFWTVMEHVPEYVRPAYVTLVATGMRTGEYLRLDTSHLMPGTCQIRVPGTKTAASKAVVSVDSSLWPWVVAAVPAPVQYGWLRLHWKKALKAAGADVTLRLHDLRHCYGQWLVNAGRPESSVQVGLRHASAAMTRRYVKQRDRGENAGAMAEILGNGTVPRLAPRSPVASTGR